MIVFNHFAVIMLFIIVFHFLRNYAEIAHSISKYVKNRNKKVLRATPAKRNLN